MGEGEAKVQEEVQGGEGVVSGGCGKVAPPMRKGGTTDQKPETNPEQSNTSL